MTASIIAQTHFTRDVLVSRRDPKTGEKLLGPDQQPIVERSLGSFTFRRPTVYDRMQIGVRRAKHAQGAVLLDEVTAHLVEIFSVIPWQVEQAPDGWDWTQQFEYWDLAAIHEAFVTGWVEILGHGTDGTRG